jgi:3-oxoadipate enol-lactonase
MTDVDIITTGDGCRIAWRYDGPEHAPVLVLSNSLGTDMGMWEPQIAAFSSHFRVLRYDQRGHGRSGAPLGGYSIDRLGRDLIELLDLLGHERVHFCGLSLGGMIGQWLGIRAPERLNRMILANTSSYMGPPDAWDGRIDLVRNEGMALLAQASVDRWFTAAFAASSPAAIAPVAAMLQATNAAGYVGSCAAIRDMDLRRSASLIVTPTLVIGGAKDPATPPPHSEALADTVPDAKLIMLEAAHLSNVECPELFRDAVLSFLG